MNTPCRNLESGLILCENQPAVMTTVDQIAEAANRLPEAAEITAAAGNAPDRDDPDVPPATRIGHMCVGDRCIGHKSAPNVEQHNCCPNTFGRCDAFSSCDPLIVFSFLTTDVGARRSLPENRSDGNKSVPIAPEAPLSHPAKPHRPAHGNVNTIAARAATAVLASRSQPRNPKLWRHDR